jgi:hypothetical protein
VNSPGTAERASTAFRILWGFDFVIGVAVIGYFILGLGNGSITAFNIGIWAVLLLLTEGLLWGSRLLYQAGRRKLATTLALLLAIPGIMVLLFFGVLLLSDTRWN